MMSAVFTSIIASTLVHLHRVLEPLDKPNPSIVSPLMLHTVLHPTET